MKAISISNARKDIYNIAEQVVKNSEPIQVTSKKGDIVVVSLDDWNAIQETLYLSSIPNMKESIAEGEKEPIEECKTLEDIGWDLN